MRVAGIAVHMASPGRPTLRIAVVDDGGGTPVLETAEEIPADDVRTVDQLLHTGRAVESRIKGLDVDRVVIRQADALYASRKPGPRLRLVTEGAAIVAARSIVVDTHIGAGKDLGDWCGTSKADVDAEGAALVRAAGQHLRYGEAAAAAFAGLSL